MTTEALVENVPDWSSETVPSGLRAADNCELDRCVYQIVYEMKPAVFPLHTVAS